MRVLRLEDEEGVGIFSSLSKGVVGMNSYCSRASLDPRVAHPCPHRDEIEINFNYNCGFRDLDELCLWFTDTNLFHLLGKLSIYIVDRSYVLHGGMQLMFDKREAILERRLKLTDYYGEMNVLRNEA